MSFPTTVTPVILDTVLGHIAPHFLAGVDNDLPAARQAASQILGAYNVVTDEELQLAADIVSFGFHVIEALGEAASPDQTSNKKIRLCGCAVSLSREGHKARRKLDQLQRARRTPAPRPEAPAPAPDAATEQAAGLVEFAREALAASAKKGGFSAFTLNRQQRRAAERITENLKRNQAEQARREAKLTAANAMIPAESADAQAAASPANT